MRDTTAVAAATTANGTSTSQIRRRRIPNMSSGVSVFPGSIAPPRAGICRDWRLRNENRVAWFQLDVLLDVLAFREFLVIELAKNRLAVLCPQDLNLLAVGVLVQPTRRGNQLQHGGG